MSISWSIKETNKYTQKTHKRCISVHLFADNDTLFTTYENIKQNKETRMTEVKLFLGKMEEQLQNLEDNSVDSVVCDPPYGLSFMNKGWDYQVPTTEQWKEVIRVLKPGGHLLAFFGSRTYHRGAVAIEDAGFEIRDQVMWCYNSGFPKSHNLGKAYDKKFDRPREDMGANPNNRPNPNNKETATHDYGFVSKSANITKGDGPLEGWGTALKPAHEPIVVARKPISEKTVLDNTIKWGTGGLNIDVSRVASTDDFSNVKPRDIQKLNSRNHVEGGNEEALRKLQEQGRWPANLISDGEVFGENTKFYFVPKVSKKDRNEGLDDLPDKDWSGVGACVPERANRPFNPSKNTHPTVKPTDLMHYLIRLVTPAGGVVLDPFMGSGSTGKAAVRHGFNFIGIEMEEESFEVAKARIEYEMEGKL